MNQDLSNNIWFQIIHTLVCEIFLAFGLFFLIFALPLIITAWKKELDTIKELYNKTKNEEEQEN